MPDGSPQRIRLAAQRDGLHRRITRARRSHARPRGVSRRQPGGMGLEARNGEVHCRRPSRTARRVRRRRSRSARSSTRRRAHRRHVAATGVDHALALPATPAGVRLHRQPHRRSLGKRRHHPRPQVAPLVHVRRASTSDDRGATTAAAPRQHDRERGRRAHQEPAAPRLRAALRHASDGLAAQPPAQQHRRSVATTEHVERRLNAQRPRVIRITATSQPFNFDSTTDRLSLSFLFLSFRTQASTASLRPTRFRGGVLAREAFSSPSFSLLSAPNKEPHLPLPSLFRQLSK